MAMNFSAEMAGRKWPCAGLGRAAAAMVTVAAVLALLGIPAGPAAAARRSPEPWGDLFGLRTPKLRRAATVPVPVPLPRPRPAEAPKLELGKPEPEPAKPEPPAEAGKAVEQAAPVPPPPSACRLALTEAVAIAPSIPDIKGAGGCGGEDLVRLEAVVLPDKRRVAVKPAAILRCAMASEIADW